MMSVWAAAALLVSGLGIAPLALSAAQALRWERDSLARGQAVLLAQDLAHRLHLNPGASTPYQLSWGQQPSAPACRDAPCSRTDWALADLTQWRTQVTQQLPGGDAWLQATREGDSTRWLVLAWASGDGSESVPGTRLPVACPERKRCLALVLSA
jgi:Tfp pilus assembly protein PilV